MNRALEKLQLVYKSMGKKKAIGVSIIFTIVLLIPAIIVAGIDGTRDNASWDFPYNGWDQPPAAWNDLPYDLSAETYIAIKLRLNVHSIRIYINGLQAQVEYPPTFYSDDYVYYFWLNLNGYSGRTVSITAEIWEESWDEIGQMTTYVRVMGPGEIDTPSIAVLVTLITTAFALLVLFGSMVHYSNQSTSSTSSPAAGVTPSSQSTPQPQWQPPDFSNVPRLHQHDWQQTTVDASQFEYWTEQELAELATERGYQSMQSMVNAVQNEEIDPEDITCNISSKTYDDLERLNAQGVKVSRAYVSPEGKNVVKIKREEREEFLPLGKDGRIAHVDADLFCKRCQKKVTVHGYHPKADYWCKTCMGPLAMLGRATDVSSYDLVKLDSPRLDAVEILSYLFLKGYFERSGRVYKSTIQKAIDEGRIDVPNLKSVFVFMKYHSLLTKITPKTIQLNPYIFNVNNLDDLSERILDIFDNKDERSGNNQGPSIDLEDYEEFD